MGHFLPMVPLAGALAAEGHEVAVASGAVVGAEAGRLGIRHFPAGPDQMSSAEREAVFPEIKELTPEQIRPFFFERVFADYELPLRAADLATVVDDWRPDLLIHEVAELAGPLVATTQNLFYATHSYGVVLGDDGVAAAARGASRHWHEAGLAPHPRAGLWEHLYLDVCPPSLQQTAPPAAPLVQLVRPGQRTPSIRTAQPLVYVTLGTVYARSDVFRAIFDGLAGEPLDAIVTIGNHGDRTALGSLPDNVRVERFVPQQELLPACSAVITHGGAGSMLGALMFGCPILFIPQGADQFTNAERAVDAGAGLRLLPHEVSPDAIRAGLRRLLDDPSFANSAMNISNEIADMPAPQAVVSVLERLVEPRTI
ncbi:MAG: glycosyltransferase [Ilumatobacteraceae bacterium]